MQIIYRATEQDDNGIFWRFDAPDGTIIWAGQQEMTQAEYEEMVRMVDDTPDGDEPDYDEDPDSDGYGWERAALRGIA